MLVALVQRGLAPALLIIPGVQPRPQVTGLLQDTSTPSELIQLATKYRIETRFDQLLDPQKCLDALQGRQIGFNLIACFPYKIPASISDILPTINIHPSPLPSYKGPHPLFWQLKHNEPYLGVSLHYVSPQWDSGDMISQQNIPRRNGSSSAQLEQALSDLAVDLIIDTMAGKNKRIESAPEASYFSAPAATDFSLRTDWRVQHAYDFIRGTDNYSAIYTVSDPRFTLHIRQASAICALGGNDKPYSIQGDQVDIAFRDGVLVAALAS